MSDPPGTLPGTVPGAGARAATIAQARAPARGAGERPAVRCSWTWLITTAPSPTAEATRLTAPERTSPTAKIPGTLVPSMSGGRPSGRPRRRR